VRRLILSFIILLLFSSTAYAFSGGSGTSGDPWQVSNITEVQDIDNNTAYYNDYFVLANNINASETSSWNGGAGFDPIGNLSDPFTGHFNGNGFTISNLYIDRPTEYYTGLFSYTNAANVYDLTLSSVDVTGDSGVGALSGYISSSTTITNVHTSGQVNAENHGGGLVGRVMGNDNVISKCSSDTDVVGYGTSRQYMGGLFAATYSSNNCLTVSNSYATGDVSGYHNIGGLGGSAGLSSTCSISNCYSTGTVSGITYYGGLTGSGTPSGDSSLSYWDTITSGQATSAFGTGKTTAQMQTQSTFTSWDFDNIWRMEGYPTLTPSNNFYVSPGNITLRPTAPPLLHNLELEMYRTGSYSYGITIATDSNYVNTAYEANPTAYPMVNYTVNISLTEDTYYMKIISYDDDTDEIETVERIFTIDDVYDLGETSVGGTIYYTSSGTLTPIKGAKVTVYNDTYSADYITTSSGYYQFLGLADNETYYIIASKDGYETSTLNIITPLYNTTVNKNIILEEENAPNYITPHYVKFIVKSVFGSVHEDVLVTVYVDDSATSSYSGYTGSDGAIGFELSETTYYRITFYKAGIIDTENYYYPINDEYTIYTTKFDDIVEDDENVYEDITISVSKEEIDSTNAYINFTYLDDSESTDALVVYINQSNVTSMGQDTIKSVDMGAVSDTSHSFTVSSYSGESYYVTFKINSSVYGDVTRIYSVNFEPVDQYEFGDGAYLWIFTCVLVLIACATTATSLGMGAILMIGISWAFKGMGFIPQIDAINLIVATILAIGYNFARFKDGDS
jgi:hypothetical protein